MPSTNMLLAARNLIKTYARGHWWTKKVYTRALEGVHLSIRSGETVALVGASGCGKTTLAMCLAGLEIPDSGEIWMDSGNLLFRENPTTETRRNIQLVFQDTFAALNPDLSIAEIVEEPMRIQRRLSKSDRKDATANLMKRAGLSPALETRRPDQLSGGQRQRVAIARALAAAPRLLVLDEPFTGLDLSIRAQILNLLMELQAEHNLTYLYISHDLTMLSYYLDRILVMRQGRIISEVSSSDWSLVAALQNRIADSPGNWHGYGV